MNNYLTNRKGKCSFWHASKLTRAGVELAVSVLENNELRDLTIESYLPFSPDAAQEGMNKILQSDAATIVSVQRLG